MFFVGAKKCPKCRTKQYVTAKKRKQTSLVGPIVVVFLFLLLNVFNFSIGIGAFISLIVLVIGFVIFPYLYEFTDKEESLF
ncbi:hypothetical protein DS745_23675 [Anaerobacillus alkaliphilus]|uniref:Cxxc_20_cxxc protein n=1 Tax=Anaerobacillus alkaliphilus TaxID=1548597 RepID=A0A4Q0VP71_9BACI|nr:hypothetical protein DS745_23675 [Anaerobacillus alkaliphilus]